MLILLFLFLDCFVNFWPLGIQKKSINLFYLLVPFSFLPSYSLHHFYLLECVICYFSFTSIHSSFILFSSIMFICLKFLYYYFLEILIFIWFPPFIFFSCNNALQWVSQTITGHSAVFVFKGHLYWFLLLRMSSSTRHKPRHIWEVRLSVE